MAATRKRVVRAERDTDGEATVYHKPSCIPCLGYDIMEAMAVSAETISKQTTFDSCICPALEILLCSGDCISGRRIGSRVPFARKFNYPRHSKTLVVSFASLGAPELAGVRITASRRSNHEGHPLLLPHILVVVA